ncbi:MAG TPA: GNAT family N-acetyltransferase [bacterium]|nr:GNAT family N-acetyltransferase [bacterium]
MYEYVTLIKKKGGKTLVIRNLKHEDNNDLQGLFRQLTNEIHFDIHQCTNKKNLVCLVLEDEKIIGFGSLIIYHIPTKGLVGRLEDIVIDNQRRGEGLGEKLVCQLIEIAKKKKLSFIELTSNSQRTAARSLYEKLGFKPKETGLYRKQL